MCAAAPAWAQDPGAYMAGQSALSHYEFEAAARYLTRALAQDPKNVTMMQDATLALLAEGEFEDALTIARRLYDLDPENQLAGLVVMTGATKTGDFDSVLEVLHGQSIGELVRDLALGWAEIGAGDFNAGLDQFKSLTSHEAIAGFGKFNLALAYGSVGDFEAADEVLSGKAFGAIPPTKRLTLAYAQTLSQLDRPDAALAALDQHLASYPDPGIAAMREAIAEGQTLSFDIARNPVEGMAEMFFDVANALIDDVDDVYVLAYLRLAQELRPGHLDATLLAAHELEALGQYRLATIDLDRVPGDSPAHLSAELARADALDQSGDADAAVALLSELATLYPDQMSVFVALGESLRRQRRYDEAGRAYDAALRLGDISDQTIWYLYYTRGITFERTGEWPKAEADFRKALELNPDQPEVLNYLGYSLVEMNAQLDEALAMIEKAVNLRPGSGYITDSLGWVYYRLGRFDDAVAPMEQAVELMATDPIVNDHLGDVYWKVGREREARFQWRRALSFDPEEADAARIRRKLAVGLDVVLDEESAAPDQANDG